MDLKIGIAESAQVIEIELPDDVDRDALKAEIEQAMGDDSAVFWVADKKGKEVGVPSGRIAFVQLGSEDTRSIGFGA